MLCNTLLHFDNCVVIILIPPCFVILDLDCIDRVESLIDKNLTEWVSLICKKKIDHKTFTASLVFRRHRKDCQYFNNDCDGRTDRAESWDPLDLIKSNIRMRVVLANYTHNSFISFLNFTMLLNSHSSWFHHAAQFCLDIMILVGFNN